MSRQKKLPRLSLSILLLIILCCVFADLLTTYDPSQMDSGAIGMPPSKEHILGTDTLGRDLFCLILYGGRASVAIGLFSGLLSTVIAVVYGAVSGLAGEKISDLMMRFAEFVMSIPSILLIIFFQAIWGKATVFSLSVIIACVSWMNISKIVRSEVRQIRQSDYVLAAGIMEGGFWYILRRHLLPNFVSSIMFMVVTNIGQAMITESTLSFLGLGLPLTTVSWGSLMSLSQEALLSGYWWIIVIPGFVLVTTLACVTDLGESVRRRNNRLYSNL